MDPILSSTHLCVEAAHIWSEENALADALSRQEPAVDNRVELRQARRVEHSLPEHFAFIGKLRNDL